MEREQMLGCMSDGGGKEGDGGRTGDGKDENTLY